LISSESSYVPDPVFSPDGNILYYLHGTKDGVKSTISIRARELATKQEKVILSVDWNKYTLRHPTISPDAQYLAYQISEWKGRTAEIRAVPLLGGESRLLVSGKAEELSPYTPPSWSPDGRFLLYFLGDPKTLERRLHRISFSSGKPEPLDLSARQLSFPALTRNGDRIAYSHGEWGDVELWKMENLLPDLQSRQ